MQDMSEDLSRFPKQDGEYENILERLRSDIVVPLGALHMGGRL